MPAHLASAGAGTFLSGFISAVPINNTPWSLGFWMRPDDTWSSLTRGLVMSLSDSGGSNGFGAYIFSGQLNFDIYGSGSPIATGGSSYLPSQIFAAGDWLFILVRYESPWFHVATLATNPSNQIEQIATHTGATPITDLTTFYFWDCNITVGTSGVGKLSLAEFWFAPYNIVNGGTAGSTADSAFVRALAYRGVGSIPSVSNKVTHYLDFLGKGAAALNGGPSFPGIYATRSRAGGYSGSDGVFYSTLNASEASGTFEPWSRPPLYPCFKRPITLLNRQMMMF